MKYNCICYFCLKIKPKSVLCTVIGVEDVSNGLMFVAEIKQDYIIIHAKKSVLPARYKTDANALTELLPFKLF